LTHIKIFRCYDKIEKQKKNNFLCQKMIKKSLKLANKMTTIDMAKATIFVAVLMTLESVGE
jgi:hypothetical protein